MPDLPEVRRQVEHQALVDKVKQLTELNKGDGNLGELKIEEITNDLDCHKILDSLSKFEFAVRKFYVFLTSAIKDGEYDEAIKGEIKRGLENLKEVVPSAEEINRGEVKSEAIAGVCAWLNNKIMVLDMNLEYLPDASEVDDLTEIRQEISDIGKEIGINFVE